MADLIPESKVHPLFHPLVWIALVHSLKWRGARNITVMDCCLRVCSRAVHIEMLPPMTTDSFILGLRCFIATRGAVLTIRCDQGTNFVSADNKFNASVKQLATARLSSNLAKKQCQFSFNAPNASHNGGMWEHQIRSIKNILSATGSLVGSRLDDSSLRCLSYEARLTVNSRPLTSVSNDPFEELLTPIHLLTMKSCQPVPAPTVFVRQVWMHASAGDVSNTSLSNSGADVAVNICLISLLTNSVHSRAEMWWW